MLTSSTKQTSMLSARIPSSLDQRMNALVEKTHRSKGYLVRKALERYLQDEEDLAELISVFEESVRNNEEGYTLAEMKKRYNLND